MEVQLKREQFAYSSQGPFRERRVEVLSALIAKLARLERGVRTSPRARLDHPDSVLDVVGFLIENNALLEQSEVGAAQESLRAITTLNDIYKDVDVGYYDRHAAATAASGLYLPIEGQEAFLAIERSREELRARLRTELGETEAKTDGSSGIGVQLRA